MNDEELRKKRTEEWASQPFRPAGLRGGVPAAEHRIAEALEYIAAQIGQINAKMDKLTKNV